MSLHPNSEKDKKIAFIATIAALAVICALLSIQSCRQNMLIKQAVKTSETLAKESDKKIKEWKDASGANHSLYETEQAKVQDLKNSSDARILALKKQVGNLKNLNSATFIASTTQDSVTGTVKDTTIYTINPVNKDTTKRETDKKFTYKDAWVSITGLVKDTTAFIKYSVKDSTTIVNEWKREKWYKRKTLMVEITNANPHTTTNKVKTIVVEQEKPNIFKVIGASVVTTLIAVETFILYAK